MLHQLSTGPGHISKLFRLGIGLATGGAFAYLLLGNIDLDEVLSLARHASTGWLLAALVALTFDFLVRIVRFVVMLNAATHNKLTFRASAGPYMASFCVNNVFPFRAGDGFRLVWFTSHFRLSGGAVFGVMLVERLLDLAVLLLFSAAALAVAPMAERAAIFIAPLSYSLVAIVAAVLALFLFPAPLKRLTDWFALRTGFEWVGAVAHLIATMSRAVLAISSPTRLVLLSGLSLLCWTFDCLVFVFVWLGMGGSGDLLIAPLLGFALGTLATLFPSLPGHFGPFDYFAVEGFTLAGADRELATGVVLLTHLVLWAPTTLAGMGWFLASSGRRKPVRGFLLEEASRSQNAG